MSASNDDKRKDVSRRDFLASAATLSALSFVGLKISGCGDGDSCSSTADCPEGDYCDFGPVGGGELDYNGAVEGVCKQASACSSCTGGSTSSSCDTCTGGSTSSSCATCTGGATAASSCTSCSGGSTAAASCSSCTGASTSGGCSSCSSSCASSCHSGCSGTCSGGCKNMTS